MLDDNRVVIADRYYDSSSAYQGYGRGIGLDFITHVNSVATQGLAPDLTILLYAEKFTSKSEKSPNRFAPNLFDDRLEQEFMDFRTKVQRGFLEIADKEKDRFLVVNALEKKDQIARKIARRVNKLLKNKSYGR